MVRKKTDACQKPRAFAPPGKLLMIERNRSINDTLKPRKLNNTLSSPSSCKAGIAVVDKSASSNKTPGSHQKKRRANPGMKALREIKKFQANTGLLVAKAPFSRIVREILQNSFGKSDFRFTGMAMMALQEATEMAIVNLLEVANLCCIHAKRVTLLPSDMRLTRRAFGVCNPVND